MQWLDRFYRYENFGSKITYNGVMVKKSWSFEVLGASLRNIHGLGFNYNSKTGASVQSSRDLTVF
jgi:hypothetical protein